MKLLELKDLT